MQVNDMAVGSGRDTPANSTKLASILYTFLPGRTLNRFEAEDHFDHCLHSTVSSLEGHGLVFERRWERVLCVRGTKSVRCKRYWLNKAAENTALANNLLKKWGLL